MVYSIEEGKCYIYQVKATAKYGSRQYVMQYAEAITYMGKTEFGDYIFLKADGKSLPLSSLVNVFPYSVGPDIYVPRPRVEPKFFR